MLSFFLERYCSDPPPPPMLDGRNGTSSWDDVLTGVTAYESAVAYTCGEGRIFLNTVTNSTYHTNKKYCQWDKRWVPTEVRKYSPHQMLVIQNRPCTVYLQSIFVRTSQLCERNRLRACHYVLNSHTKTMNIKLR